MILDDGWLYLELDDVKKIIAQWGLKPIQSTHKVDSALSRPRTAPFGHNPFPDAASKAAALGWVSSVTMASSTATSDWPRSRRWPSCTSTASTLQSLKASW
ncbi:hypothetical protein PSU4_30060 [Pseudonocardia sulfidoxydans NBRC 16205]|uniref:Uncharacterized protein n=1 Tax=Pseudonocardia sulfidoxydans NBRC 16205 TaxID=1223511 RepID=A0A511DGY9_9PSEU|nr:hypothetical protein PSU4_30060 [Pseudonocardia sulfidoxydans NBRC 16205]